MYYALPDQPAVLSLPNNNIVDILQTLSATPCTLLATNVGNIQHVNEYPKSKPTRNFITAVCPDTNDNRHALSQLILEILNQPISIIFSYQRTTTVKSLRFFIQLDKDVEAKQYTQLVRSMSAQLNITFMKADESINKQIDIPAGTDYTIIYSNPTGKPMLVNDIETPSTDNSQLIPDKDKLMTATRHFLNEPTTADIFMNNDKFTSFIDALVSAKLDGMLTSSYINEALEAFATYASRPVTDFKQFFDTRMAMLSENSRLKEEAKPFGEYIHLYVLSEGATNIAQQLKASLPVGVKPDADYSIAEASEFIEMVYPPYLLDQHGSDVDNLVIFNSATGVWTQDPDTLYSLITALKPFTPMNQFDTFIRTLAAKARNANRFIKPYSGSNYILFENGFLDVRSMELRPITDPMTRHLHFTERSHINIPFIPDPPIPYFPGKRLYDNGSWDPKSFISAYADNDTDRYNYLLFGMALGLFGGHNFGVHFDIQGSSRWGKTTLSEIYAGLYSHRILTISFTALNGQFPFTSYPANTSLIWIKECNEGVDPLNDEYGTVTYDGLADNQVRLHVKHKGDMVISNPPPVFIDGTQLIKAKEIFTGPAGRTLPYKLPTMTDELRNQAYSSSIMECLHDTRTLQWFVWEMLRCYKLIVPEDRIDDFKVNLANKNDLALFPEISLVWRQEFVSASSTIDYWFDDEIAPFISTNPKRPTYMHKRILYEMYSNYYRKENPHDKHLNGIKTLDQLMNRVKQLMQSHHIESTLAGTTKDRNRKTIGKPEAMNFDWASYIETFGKMPAILEPMNYHAMDLFGSKQYHWMKWVKDPSYTPAMEDTA